FCFITGSKSKTSMACVGSAISLARSRGAHSIGSVERSVCAKAPCANSGLAARNCSMRRRLAMVIGDMLVPSSSPGRVGLHQAWCRGSAQESVPAPDRADAPERPWAFDGEQMSALLQFGARCGREAVLQDDAPRFERARMERLHHVPGLKHRRIDGLLQAHAVMREPQEYRQDPLLLLIAARRADRQI